jgi:kynurenine formamidase
MATQTATKPGGRKIPTEAEVLTYFKTLSNWGRWGADDELGTLNLITPAKRLEAARLVTEGLSVGCARPIVLESPQPDVTAPPLHYMLTSGEVANSQGAADFLGITPHGLTISHIDTLSHKHWDGQMYNGKKTTLITTAQGATRYSVETMKDGIVTRGVLLDVTKVRGVPYLEAGDGIFPEDLEAAERAQGVRVGPGDALLLRTGWYKRRVEQGAYPVPRHRPGLHASSIPWLRERDVALVGADASEDCFPSGYPNIELPLHSVGIVAMGLCLMDALQFDDVVPHCERLGRWEFLFVVAPMRFRYATASPTTPLAIF